jgi:8-oxo-dGTP diphosphatase
MTRVIVAAAVIEADGRFLVTRRPPGVHLAGHWEFPGGKCDPGESLDACLRRELVEELGCTSTIHDELLVVHHDYPERVVELHFIECRLTSRPSPVLGQEMRWVPREELTSLTFPPADDELIALLTSPPDL